MKLFAALLVGVVGLSASSNPISRIVTLLNGLKSKLEDDLKAETELFETYHCWVKTTTSTKSASNDAANSRVDSLKSYIKDIEAGKIEFTTERQDLEKQVAGLSKDLETAKTMRDQEKKDFEAAETEMKQAVSALDGAIKTIEDGTKGSLAQTRSYIDMLSTRHEIEKSMAFASGLLDGADQKYLQQILNGDEPKDWKKLNRKATFKMKYAKSSGKILKTLGGLRTTFKKNLEEAQAQEKAAQESYDKLKTSKGNMLDTANKALKDMTLENGARGVSKTEAQNEVDALEAQVKADTKFISEAKSAFETKQKEWDARSELRGKEILAMSQAIAVLASDDAKDQFKSSFKSQGYFFLQEVVEQSEPQRRGKCAARLLGPLASKSSDPTLALLANLAKSGSNEAIQKVIKKVDEIVKLKDAEEKEDLEKKQKCESDLSDAASAAKKASLAMDTATEDMARADSQIAELKTQIKEQEDKKKGLEGQIKDATSQRADENKMFKADKLADEKAVELVKSAINIVKDWKNAKKASLIDASLSMSQRAWGTYADKVTLKVAAPTAPEGILPAPAAPSKANTAAQAPHRLAAASIKVHTAQKSSKQAPQFQVAAGAAPPPPPPTWDAGATYGGASEQGGIVGILELVMADMEKDIKSGEADEKQAETDFAKTKADLEGEVKACADTIDAYTKDKSAKAKTLAEKSTERGTKKKELDSQMDLYNGYKPGCDFLLVNFDTRTKARQIEIDGLKKAKAILQGAKFGKSFMQVEC